MKIFDETGHLRDEALLLGGERCLPMEQQRQAELHLGACPACSERRQLLVDVENAFRSKILPASLPGPERARSRLRAGLTATTRVSWWQTWGAPRLRPGLMLRVGTVAALMLLLGMDWRSQKPFQKLLSRYEQTGPEPDRRLTPGSTSPVSVAHVCGLKDDDLDPKLSPEKRSAVFRAYHMDERSARAYQVDYLVNPQLGGNDQLENLWPEPYQATVWNAAAKDALEKRLHTMVCSQQIDLQTAQRELATDWIASYKRHFHASFPSE